PCFFTPPPTTHLYPLSLHDALPISSPSPSRRRLCRSGVSRFGRPQSPPPHLRCRPAGTCPPARCCPKQIAGEPSPSSRAAPTNRSEEHTSELQSLTNLLSRLLL